jgi:TetR/AcrR family transcriptional repressor of nem operon
VARHKEFDPDVAIARAMDLFWRQGFRATTPAELTAALGIGKGSLYNAFESKQALFAQALRRYGDERVAGVTKVLKRQGGVRERLLAALERIASPEVAHLRRRGCFAVNTVTELGFSDHAAHTIVCDVFARMERAFQTAIEEGQSSGEISRERDAKDLAALLLTTMLGMTVLGKSDDRPERLRSVAQTVMSLV